MFMFSLSTLACLFLITCPLECVFAVYIQSLLTEKRFLHWLRRKLLASCLRKSFASFRHIPGVSGPDENVRSVVGFLVNSVRLFGFVFKQGLTM